MTLVGLDLNSGRARAVAGPAARSPGLVHLEGDRAELLDQIRDEWVAGAWAGDRAEDWDTADTTDRVAAAIYDNAEGGDEDDAALDDRYAEAEARAKMIVAAFEGAAGLKRAKAFALALPARHPWLVKGRDVGNEPRDEAGRWTAEGAAAH